MPPELHLVDDGDAAEHAASILAQLAELDRLDAQAATANDVPPTTWTPIDLNDALNGIDVPPPSTMRRTDGVNLLYAGRTHGFAGESESLKSWAAQVAAQQELDVGHDVLWIDFEDDASGVVARLLALGASRQAITEHFVYVRPEEPLRGMGGTWTAGGIDFERLIVDRQWSLIVIDGVTEAMVTEGLELNDNGDIATWSRLLPKRCANTGAAVVMLDHVPKAIDNRGRYAIGGQHKLAGLTGAQYVFEVERSFSRARTEPITGIVKITVTKDRPGHVRTHATNNVIARIELTSYPDGGVSAAIVPPGEGNAPLDLTTAKRIVDHLTIYPKSSKNGIETAIGGNVGTIRQTLVAMVTAGWITVETNGRAHLHTLTDDGNDHFNA